MERCLRCASPHPPTSDCLLPQIVGAADESRDVVVQLLQRGQVDVDHVAGAYAAALPAIDLSWSDIAGELLVHRCHDPGGARSVRRCSCGNSPRRRRRALEAPASADVAGALQALHQIRFDTCLGTGDSNLIGLAIIVCAATTLHAADRLDECCDYGMIGGCEASPPLCWGCVCCGGRRMP